MRHFWRATLLAAAILIGPSSFMITPSPASAQDTADAAYLDLYAAMNEVYDRDAEIEATIEATRREFLAVPDIAYLEAISPGLVDEVLVEMRPVLIRVSERIREQYKPEMIAVFRRYLTPEEASGIAGFYRSDLGRKLMLGASQSYSPDTIMQEAMKDGVVSQEQVAADINASSKAAVDQMTPEELIEIDRQAALIPGFYKLGLMRDDIFEVRTRSENEPPNKVEEAEIERVIEAVIARRLGSE